MIGLSGDPINNRKVPLDANIMGALLGSYLRNDPESHPYIMPHFRLQQLVNFIMPSGNQFQRNKIFHGTMMQANIVEHISVLYSLSMYMLVTPNINSEAGTVFNVAKILQATMSECLIVMHSDPKQQLELHHPYTLFQRSGSDQGGTIIETFRQALHVCKDIIRDIVKQLRTARDPAGANAASSFREKYDCWYAHSLYYMCSMGLCHFGVIAASTMNLNAVPGTMESMLLIACLHPRPYRVEPVAGKGKQSIVKQDEEVSKFSSNDATLAPPVRFSKEESTRFYLCFEFLLNCAKFSVRKAFDFSSLQELRMSKRRIISAATHPNCEYARLKVSELKAAFLGVPSPSLVEDEPALQKLRRDATEYIRVGAEGLLPDWYTVRPKLGDGIDLDQPMGLNRAQTAGSKPLTASTPNSTPSTSKPSTAVTSAGKTPFPSVPATPAVGTADPSRATTVRSKLRSLYATEEDDWKQEPIVPKGEEEWRKKKSVFSKVRHGPSTPMKPAGDVAIATEEKEIEKAGGRKAVTLPSGKKHAQSEEEAEVEKEILGFWSINKNFRPAYFATRVLRRAETVLQFLAEDFRPKNRFRKKAFDFYSNPSGGLSSLSKQIAIKNILSIYYDQYRDAPCPRISNPSHGLFWVCNFLLDYVYQATFYGGGFNKDPSAKTKRIMSDKLMADMLLESHGIHNGSGLVASSPGSSPFKSSKTSRTSAMSKKTGTTMMSMSANVNASGSAEEKIDIFQKLKLVAREAHTACQIDELQREKRAAAKHAKTSAKPRIKKVDQTLREGTQVMRGVATEQSELFEVDSEDMYSATDSDDDYSDTESDSASGTESSHSQEEEERSVVDGSDDDRRGSGKSGGSARKNSQSDRRKTSKASSISAASDKQQKFYLDATDPFVQLALMQADRTNDKGQVMGEISNHDPLQFYMQQPTLGDINRFRKSLKKNGLVKMGQQNLLIDPERVTSVVWTPEAAEHLRTENVAAKMGIGKLSKTEQAKQYVEEIKKVQKVRAEEAILLAKEMEDIQEMEVSKSLAYIAGLKYEAQEARKQDKLENAAIVAGKLEEKKREIKTKASGNKMDEKRRKELESMERARIQDIRQWKIARAQEEKMVLDERMAMETIRIRKLESEKEYHEILRRNREEARMKYLEERRRFIEHKGDHIAAAAAAALEQKRAAWKKDIQIAHTRIRDGAFHAKDVDGSIGFYDDIRPTPVDWVQYEDDNGVSYYYDPVLKKTSYDYPANAAVHHHTVDDRAAYDAIHGVGTYDAHIFNERMIASVNEYGGYFNHDGFWEEVNGFYDENGRFWDLNKGYFDQYNKWVLYPEVKGTLDFMV